jgi:tetratricopeptide (TPR) repeat protein
MLRPLLLIAITGALGTNLLAQTKPYGGFDAQKILIPGDQATGKESAVNGGYLDSWIDELAIHAKNYPVKFDTDADKAQAIRDITFLAGLMDTINEPTKPNLELLRRAGFINSIAHNLDVKGAAQKSTDYFTRLLKVAPDDPVGNQMFGAFLGGAGHPKEAIPYLLKADSLGIRSAAFSLGMSYLMLGDKAKALEFFEKYRKAVPEDKSVDQLIDAIKTDRVGFKKT